MNSELSEEALLRRQIISAKKSGDLVMAKRLIRRLERLSIQIEGSISGGGNEHSGRTCRSILMLSGSPQMDDFSDDSNP